MAIKSVGQTNSAFFVDESVDPASYGGTFLSYNPDTNSYEYVGYEEMLAATQVPDAATGRTQTIGDMFRRASGSSPVGGPVSPVDRPEGSIYRAAAGWSAAMTVKDVLSAGVGSPVGLALSAYEGTTSYQKGITRAEVFEQAQTPTATIKDLLSASQQKPEWTDYLGDTLTMGAGVAFAQPEMIASGGIGLAATISASREADEALESAGQLERLGYASGLSPSQVSGFTGYQQTIADFMANQATNLAAVQTEEEPTALASTSPVQDIQAQTIGSVFGTAGYRYSSSSQPSSITSGTSVFGKDHSTAEAQREAYAEATKGTSEDSFGFGGSDGGDFDRDSGYGGFGGGTGAGGFEGDIGGGGFGGYA